jgi:hypothetical protein
MQAWLFHSGFWTPGAVQAFLGAVPLGRMLILDLNTETGPVWNKFDAFYGHVRLRAPSHKHAHTRARAHPALHSR